MEDAHAALNRLIKRTPTSKDTEGLLTQTLCCTHILLMVRPSEDVRYTHWVHYTNTCLNKLGYTDVPDIVLLHILSGVLEYATDIHRYGRAEVCHKRIIRRLMDVLQNCYPQNKLVFNREWESIYAT